MYNNLVVNSGLTLDIKWTLIQVHFSWDRFWKLFEKMKFFIKPVMPEWLIILLDIRKID